MTYFSKVYLLLALGFVASVASSSAHICKTCPDPYQYEWSGVGFDFTIDYATSAVYQPDGTTFAVRKIEGSSAYKSMMRKFAVLPESDHASVIHQYTSTEACRSPDGDMGHILDTVVSTQSESSNTTCAEPSPFMIMLHALKTSTEHHLGSKINESVISSPFGGAWNNLLDPTLAQAGVRRTGKDYPSSMWLAAFHAMCNYDPVGCYKEGSEYILVVDYSRSMFASTLFLKEDGQWSALKDFVDINLGSQSARAIKDGERYWSYIKGGLVDYAQVPAGHKVKLVLMGDATNDDDFIETLQDVFGEDYLDIAEAGNSYGGQKPLGIPIMTDEYTAAKGAAAIARSKLVSLEGSDGCQPAQHCAAIGIARSAGALM